MRWPGGWLVLRSTIRWHLLVGGLLKVVVLTLGLMAASLLLDRLLRMETSSRIALALLGFAAIGGGRLAVDRRAAVAAARRS